MPETPERPHRFLTLAQVAEELNTSKSQIYALVKRQDLRAIKIGGRGQWRIERAALEAYITKAYTDTEVWLDENPDPVIEDDDDSTGTSR